MGRRRQSPRANAASCTRNRRQRGKAGRRVAGARQIGRHGRTPSFRRARIGEADEDAAVKRRPQDLHTALGFRLEAGDVAIGKLVR